LERGAVAKRETARADRFPGILFKAATFAGLRLAPPEVRCKLGPKAGGYTAMHVETAMSTSNRIEINPEVMLGKPVIRGTRITVELLLRSLSEGATAADLLEAYPHLTHEDIQAAIAYAADVVGREKQIPLKSRA
jgi:uncharacterized protein (DUF433 family)